MNEKKPQRAILDFSSITLANIFNSDDQLR